jgi:hypothetical protein
MSAAAGGRTRMGRATLASVAIHVLVALSIPALALTLSTAAPIETVSFTHILHVEIKPPVTPHPQPRPLAPRHEVRPRITIVNPVRIAAAAPHRHAAAAPAVATDAPAAPSSAGTVVRAGSGAAESAAAPNVTPSPVARAVASLGTRQSGGYLPFGAQQPDPVLDPDVRKQLDALGTHVTLIVTVGDDGRTESVAFEPPVDEQLETRIRSLLADASWDPAVCGGGVACEARTTIRL